MCINIIIFIYDVLHRSVNLLHSIRTIFVREPTLHGSVSRIDLGLTAYQPWGLTLPGYATRLAGFLFPSCVVRYFKS